MKQFNMSAIAGAAGILGLVKAVQGLANSLKGVISNYSHFESMQKGLETFFQSADKGKAKFEELRKLSNQTTFGVDELSNAFTQFANVGTDVDTINDKLMMLGNISGGNKQKFAELVSIYSKILSVGKAGSEQIQMLAMRGVPIYDMLKKIGVTGTASGKQITQAFEEMTKEGGQFYNAMNNINDTIEGKEGFISDYFKEFTVNFAEASGIADIYKNVLDILKEAIGHLSDTLLTVNENPLLKALFQGALVASISAIATVIVANIIPSLKKVIAMLVQINILKGPKGWATLAVAGIAGVTTAIISATKGLREANKEAEKLSEKMKGVGGSGYSGDNGFTGQKYSNEDELSRLQGNMNSYIRSAEELRGKINLLKPALDSTFASAEQKKQIQSNITSLNAQLETYRNLIKLTSAQIEKVRKLAYEEKNIAELHEKVKNFSDEINDAYDLTEAGKSLKEIEDLEKKIDDFSNKYNELSLHISENSKQKFNAVISEWQDKLSSLKINFEFAQNPWKKDLKEILNLSDDDVKELMNKGFTGENAANRYGQNIKKRQSNIADAYALMGFSQNRNDLVNQSINDFNEIKDKILTLANTKGFDVKNDKVFIALNKQLQEVTEKLKSFGIEIDDAGNVVDKYPNIISETTSTLFENAKIAFSTGDTKKGIGLSVAANSLSTLSQYSGDINNFAQGFQTGGIWGGIIATVIGAIANVASDMEDFDKVMNPVTAAMEKLAPLINIILDDLAWATDTFVDIFAVIGAVVQIFSPLIKLISGLTKTIALPIRVLGLLAKEISKCADGFGDFVDKIFGWLDFFDEKEEKEEEQNVDLTESYKALLEAMKSNQEEYEKRKKELNASDYASKVTGVHDMILTPQGNFSTDPDDYIIATKNPSGLNGGGQTSVIQLQPIINNTMADSAKVGTTIESDTNGLTRLVVTISRKVASDYVSGDNGWAGALATRNQKINGRSLAI